MRLRGGWMVLLSMFISHGAQAQQVDCDRIRTTTVPYEVRIDQEITPSSNSQGMKAVVRTVINQIHRSSSGGAKVTYAKQGEGAVAKTTGYGMHAVELSVGSRPRIKMEYKGIDLPNLRSGANYAFEQTISIPGGEPETYSVDVVVAGKKTVVLSNCSFDVVRYISKSVATGSKPGMILAEIEYMPQLQEIYSSKTANSKTMFMMTFVAREISLDFTPLE